MRIDILTIFPQLVRDAVRYSIVKRAQEIGVLAIEVTDPREFTSDKHRTVDDVPYGGGAGMVMKVEPIVSAVRRCLEDPHPPHAIGLPLDATGLLTESQVGEGMKSPHPNPPPQAGEGISAADATGLPLDATGLLTESQVFEPQVTERAAIRVVLLEPQGKLLTQADLKRWAGLEQLILICGHYEGTDHRIAEHVADEVISLGDYVLSGGEVPALVIIDGIARLLAGVLGNEESLAQDSFEDGLLGYPQFTRPEEYCDWRVPEVLLSGHHGDIQRWRRARQLLETRTVRPDLFARAPITENDVRLLADALRGEVDEPR